MAATMLALAMLLAAALPPGAGGVATDVRGEVGDMKSDSVYHLLSTPTYAGLDKADAGSPVLETGGHAPLGGRKRALHWLRREASRAASHGGRQPEWLQAVQDFITKAVCAVKEAVCAVKEALGLSAPEDDAGAGAVNPHGLRYPSAKEEGEQEFKITITKGTIKTLGLSFYDPKVPEGKCLHDTPCLKVEKVNPGGLIEIWNNNDHTDQDQKVEAGNEIIMVNEVSESYEKMMEIIQKENVQSITVIRVRTETIQKENVQKENVQAPSAKEDGETKEAGPACCKCKADKYAYSAGGTCSLCNEIEKTFPLPEDFFNNETGRRMARRCGCSDCKKLGISSPWCDEKCA